LADLEGVEAYTRGHHNTIYAVELPAWLPVKILDRMVSQFQKHLRVALIAMMKRIPDPDNCTHRHEIFTEPPSVWTTTTSEIVEHHPSLDSPLGEQDAKAPP
jgi:hypothetical protein